MLSTLKKWFITVDNIIMNLVILVALIVIDSYFLYYSDIALYIE